MGDLDESPEDELLELLSCHRSDLGLQYTKYFGYINRENYGYV